MPVAGVRDGGWLTFSTIATPGVHYERATCARVGCEREANGWRVLLDETLPLGRLRAAYIRNVTNRRYTEHRDETGVTVFTFPPGTPCFQDGRDARAQATFECNPHTRATRQAIHVVQEGPNAKVAEHIARTGRPVNLVRAHQRPQDWAEHLAESWNTMMHHIN